MKRDKQSAVPCNETEETGLNQQRIWELFPSYLIDHCEGETVSEEFLQGALAEMLADKEWLGQCEKVRLEAAANHRVQMSETKPVAASTDDQQQKAFYDVSQDISRMVVNWVERGIKGGTDWRNGLPEIIALRLKRKHLEAIPASKDKLIASLQEKLRVEIEIVDRVWKALGISTYEQANGMAIDEIVAALQQQRDALLEACKGLLHPDTIDAELKAKAARAAIALATKHEKD